MWPGRLKSVAFASGRAMARSVLARSAAEMPVVISSVARSIETPNAVPFGSSFLLTIGPMFRWSSVSPGAAAQMTPDE